MREERYNDRGIILTQGDKFGGWGLYMDNGKPAYTYATQVVPATFKDVHDSEFTGYVKKLVIKIPEKK